MLTKKAALSTVFVIWSVIVLGCGLPTQMSSTPTKALQQPSPDPQAVQVTETIEPEVAADPQPTTQVPTVSNGAKVNYQGVSFSYDLKLANSVSAKILPAIPGEPGQIGWIGSVPESYEFNFDGYVLDGTFHTPHMLIYPIQDFASINEPVGQIADDLETLLVEFDSKAEPMPFLPLWNAAQVFNARATQLNFMNGRGISYLTCFAQAILPINQECLFYTFQGITYDKQYYVAAIFPVNHPDLNSAENTAKFDEVLKTSDGAKYEAYIKDVRDQLEEWAPDSYVPSISSLDALIGTLSVQPTVKLRSPEASATVDCPSAMGARLKVGYPARVTFTDGKALRVRKEPGKNETVLGQLPEGTEMVISSGPVCVGDGLWWEMISADGKMSGWVLEGEDGSYFVEPWQ